MSLDAFQIYLNKRSRVDLEPGGYCPAITAEAASLNRNVEGLGYTMDPELLCRVGTLSKSRLEAFADRLVEVLRESVGAHRKFEPMYPNFPKQVMEASDLELYLNAVMHYWGSWVHDVLDVPVRWMPEYQKEDRPPLPKKDSVKLRVIRLGNQRYFHSIFTDLAAGNASLPESDKDALKWFLTHLSQKEIQELLPVAIPQKETLALIVGTLLNLKFIPTYLSTYLAKATATDGLRIAAVMSGGDVSLAAPTKFRRFRRPERRFFLEMLELIGHRATEDMLRYKERWKRLGRELRVGDYAAKYPIAVKAFDVLRNDRKFETFNGSVEAALLVEMVDRATDLLVNRPGDFVRRLDHLLRSDVRQQERVIRKLWSVSGEVSTPVLLQAYAHFANRGKADHRAFFPKGSTAKVQLVEGLPKDLGDRGEVSGAVASILYSSLANRFSKLPKLGKCWVDPELKNHLVPFSRRSASKSLRTLTRGSRLPLPDSNTVRTFVWWKDGKERTDLDLAAVFFADGWKRLAEVSYYSLKEWGCCHSGDVTSAPNGACEFIDMDIKALLSNKVRYVQTVVYCYTRQPFCDLPECFGGWMARSEPQSGEVFEGRAVRDKIDVASDSTVCIPMILDLRERHVIWSDIALKGRGAINNSSRNSDSLVRMGRAVEGLVLTRPNLHDLFQAHVTGRGTEVAREEDADTVFSIDRGVTPFDQDRIVGEFLSN